MKHRGHFTGQRPGPLFFLFLAFLLAASALVRPAEAASTEPVAIEAAGAAAIVSNDTASARDAAIADALRKAVEQAVGTVVAADTLVENFQVLEDSVYTKSAGYVKSYSIIAEGRSGQTYEVRVRALVATGELGSDLESLGLILHRAGKPAVLFMVAEKGFARDEYDYWWGQDRRTGTAAEAALKQAFLSKGFDVVDSRAVEGLLGPLSADLTGEDAARMGRALDAEVVVFGKVFLEQGPSSGATSVVTYLADMTAQAVRVDDGAVLGAQKGHGVSRHISKATGSDEAVGRAAAIVAEGLVTQIAAKWAGPHAIRITLKGMDYDKVVEFKKFLKTRVRGISAIYQRRHGEGETSIDVESAAGAGSVADEIARHGNYRVIGFSASTIEVEGAE